MIFHVIVKSIVTSITDQPFFYVSTPLKVLNTLARYRQELRIVIIYGYSGSYKHI